MKIDLSKKPYYLNDTQISFVKEKTKNMTLEEKVGQLFFVISQDDNRVDLKDFIDKYKPGGMMFRPEAAEKIKREIELIQEVSDIPLFMAANLESGGNGLIAEGTWFGTPLQIAATDDPENAYLLGKVAGHEAAQVGANMAFAPIVDIDVNFRNPIMNTRTFGSSQKRVLEMSLAECEGLNRIILFLLPSIFLETVWMSATSILSALLIHCLWMSG
jgi:beta-N-acetylhexosaminidase